MLTTKKTVLSKSISSNCRIIYRSSKPENYLATRFYPRAVRQANDVLMAFVFKSKAKVASGKESSIKEFGQWAQNWVETYQTGDTKLPILKANYIVWYRYKIPFEYSEKFLAGLTHDLERTSFADLADLDQYLGDVYGTVNQINVHITGFIGGEETLKRAELFGKALGLVDILTQAKKDINQRNHIYFAKSDLDKFKIKTEDLQRLHSSEQVKAMVKVYVETALTWFESATPYITYLPPATRFPWRIIGSIAEAKLNLIIENDYEIFAKPVSLSIYDKLLIIKNTWRSNWKLDRI